MARSSSARVALVCGLFAVTAVGCGDPSGNAPTEAAPRTTAATSLPRLDYAARINALCAELEPKVLEIYGGGGHPSPFPIKVFESEQPQLTSLYSTFDAQADAVPVTDAEQRAVKAFTAYRRVSDAATATMSAAAATGRQSRFDAAYYAVHKMFDNNPVVNELHAAGISCNAR